MLGIGWFVNKQNIPLRLSRGNTVIFIVVDHLKKYVHFGGMPTNFNAKKVVELFMEIVVTMDFLIAL